MSSIWLHHTLPPPPSPLYTPLHSHTPQDPTSLELAVARRDHEAAYMKARTPLGFRSQFLGGCVASVDIGGGGGVSGGGGGGVFAGDEGSSEDVDEEGEGEGEGDGDGESSEELERLEGYLEEYALGSGSEDGGGEGEAVEVEEDEGDEYDEGIVTPPSQGQRS